VQDEAGDESVLQLVPQPDQVAGVLEDWGGGRLDLDPEDSAASQVEDEVDLLAAGFGAEVVQQDPGSERELRA
jgi:hypothetical protein